MRLGADAANISVIARELHPSNFVEHSYRWFATGPGKFKVTLKVRDSWLGARQKTRVLETDSGFYVGDACYIIPDENWGKYLEDTAYLEKDTKHALHLHTGGDGLFNVRVIIKEVL